MKYLSILLCLLVVVFAAGAQGQTDDSLVPRLSNGRPDLQGIWDYRTMTPLERPVDLQGKSVFTDEEAAEFLREALDNRNADRRDGTDRSAGIGSDVERAYNDVWWDYGRPLTDDKRTSVIIDPPDGRIPYTTEARLEESSRFDRFFAIVAAGPEDRGLWERCITRDLPRLSGAYNNNFQLFQTEEYVAILNEMVHEVRMIPLDKRSHVSEHIRQWQGNSVGHWDGDTLVVETRNFTDKTNFRGSRANLLLVERFTRLDTDTLLYEFTVEDSSVWTREWTAAVPMVRNDGRMYEYACHEGNYGMVGILAGARADEKMAAVETGAESR